MNRKPRSKFFETEMERDRFIRAFQQEMGTHGEEGFKIDAKLMRDWIEVAEILPGAIRSTKAHAARADPVCQSPRLGDKPVEDITRQEIPYNRILLILLCLYLALH